MANTLPPVPYKSQVTDDSGYLTQAWSVWFRELNSRVGGTNAPTIADLASGQASDFTVLSAQVAAIQSGTLTNGPDL